jgi:hypothetical protein
VRLKSTLVVLLMVVAVAAPLPVTGQEQPLPPVVPRVSVDFPTVALVVEPFHAVPRTTLADAARANDFPTFDALFREANRHGEQLGAYATLHELWSSSINDPVGAFYGPELYQRLSRAYPGYAKFIDDYRIIDDRGNVFYPASETRTFLLARAVEGVQTAPRVLVADGTPASSRQRTSTQHVAPTRTAARDAAGPAGEDASAPKATRVPAKVAHTRVAHTRVAHAKVAHAPVAHAQVADARASVAPVNSTPVESAPVETAPVTTPADTAPVSAPLVAQTQPQTPAAEVAAPPVVKPITPPQDNLGNRGILLLVIGLIGIGLLAIMLRTPKESQPQTIIKPTEPAPAQTAAAAEPLRRPTPAPKPVEPAASDSNRATGSHG